MPGVLGGVELGKEWVLTRAHELPSGGGAVLLGWRKWCWRCRSEDCPQQRFTEQVGQVPAAMRTTTRLREGWCGGGGGVKISPEVAAACGVSWPMVQRVPPIYSPNLSRQMLPLAESAPRSAS